MAFLICCKISMSLIQPGFVNLSPEKRALLEARLQQKAAASSRESVIPRRDLARPCRLSVAQEQLWFLDQVQPGRPTYNIAEVLRLRGSSDTSVTIPLRLPLAGSVNRSWPTRGLRFNPACGERRPQRQTSTNRARTSHKTRRLVHARACMG